MRVRSLLLALGVAGPTSLLAQTGAGARPEIRPFASLYVPMGSLRGHLTHGSTVGLQGALEMSSRFHLLSTLSWTAGHEKHVDRDELTQIWQYDVGAELNTYREVQGGWLLRPFIGVGVGGRTYKFPEGVPLSSCAAAYGALGTELQKRRLAYRLEWRSYVSCYKSPGTHDRDPRTDYQFAAGFAYHLF
jgi:hypothetical protein